MKNSFVAVLAVAAFLGIPASEVAACESLWQRAAGFVMEPDSSHPARASLSAHDICTGEGEFNLWWEGAEGPVRFWATVTSSTSEGCLLDGCAFGPLPGGSFRLTNESLAIDLQGYALPGPYLPVQAWSVAGIVFGSPAAFAGQSLNSVNP